MYRHPCTCLLLCLLALVAGGCRNPAERARLKLQEQGLPLTASSYLQCVRDGRQEQVRLYLRSGLMQEARDPRGCNALMIAAEAGQTALIEPLLASGLTVNGRSPDGSSALHLAAAGGHTKIAETLLHHGADPTLTDHKKHTPLSLAFAHRQLEVVDFFLGHNIKPGPDGAQGQPLLVWAVAAGHDALARRLIESGEKADTPASSPADSGFITTAANEELEYYLRRESGVTPLMIAAAKGNLAMVEFLLQHGANRHRGTSKHETTAVYLASINMHPEIIQVLLGKSPKPEDQVCTIEVSLKKQRATLFKNGQPEFTSPVSTGRPGFRTPPGVYVVTDKYEDWKSTIYEDAEMPYFLRLSCGTFGLHAGVLPGYPASHGCIRLPYEKAKTLFGLVDVGTLVTITN